MQWVGHLFLSFCLYVNEVSLFFTSHGSLAELNEGQCKNAMIFSLDPSYWRGQVCKRKFCLSVCLFVRHRFNLSTLWCFRPYKPYIFWKLLVQGYLNWYSQVSHTKIHKYKYTNTQIHKYSALPSAGKTQQMAYFWKEDCSRVSNMIFPCVKHTNTKNINTQIHKIHKYSIWQSARARKTQHVCTVPQRLIFPIYDVSWDLKMCSSFQWCNICWTQYWSHRNIDVLMISLVAESADSYM